MNSVPEALKTRAYVAPFAVFMGFTLLWQLGGSFLEWNHPRRRLVEKGAGAMAVPCAGHRLLCPGPVVEKSH